MKKIYIAGPMTGRVNLNFPAFHAAAAQLRAEGYSVANPAEFQQPDDATWEFYMRKDISELVKCDAIYMLQGWIGSRGANLEHTIATALSMEVIYQ